MENPVSPAVDPVSTPEPAIELQPPAPSISKPESALDPTDLSDTTESEAEKHGCK